MKGIMLQSSVISLGIFLILGSGGGGSSSTTLLSTPSNVTVTSAYQGAILTWDAVTDASTYQICSATENILDFSNCANYTTGTLTAASTNAAIIDALTPGQRAYFSVTAEATGKTSSNASANVSTTPSLGINDTGAISCGGGLVNNLPCPIIGYPNQDAQNGLDTQTTNSQNGVSGFNFTKLDSNGMALAASANTWSCVKDNITGLVWEAKTDANHNDSFKWYNPDTTNNAGSSGDENSSGSSCAGYDAADSSSYCNTKAYTDRVNTEGYCGITHWRMPSRQELNSIVNYNTVSPAIDLAYFTYNNSALYWSGTPSFSSSSASDFAWATNFNYGGSAKQSKLDSLHVRLVNNGQL